MPTFTKETRDNMLCVRDNIAALYGKQFNMSTWGVPEFLRAHKCGSAGCIGGWTEALLVEKTAGEEFVTSTEVGAKIGLSARETDDLFFMESTTLQMCQVTQLHAVKMLDHLLAGGEVDWDAIIKIKDN